MDMIEAAVEAGLIGPKQAERYYSMQKKAKEPKENRDDRKDVVGE